MKSRCGKAGFDLSDGIVNVTFVHPTNLSETLTAKVSESATALYLIEQLVAAGFIRPADSVGQYKLRTQEVQL